MCGGHRGVNRLFGSEEASNLTWPQIVAGEGSYAARSVAVLRDSQFVYAAYLGYDAKDARTVLMSRESILQHERNEKKCVLCGTLYSTVK